MASKGGLLLKQTEEGPSTLGACLQSQLPAMEMHRCELRGGRVHHVDVPEL